MRVIEQLRRTYGAWGPWRYDAKTGRWVGLDIVCVRKISMFDTEGIPLKVSYWFERDGIPFPAGGIW